MSFGKILLLIIVIILLLGLLLIPFIKIIAHISIIRELKRIYGSKESFKYVGFILFQGLLALIGAVVIGWLVELLFNYDIIKTIKETIDNYSKLF